MQICMDWKSVTFDWNRARAFLVTAEEGSFSAAARALGTTQPTVGRQVAALEAELEVTLFERVGHGLELTAAGLALVEHVRAMGEAAMQVSLAAAGRSMAIEGPVCISASEVCAYFELPSIIAGIRAEHPGLQIEVVASNSISDLRRREADIAIRAFRPSEPDLFARKVREQRARLYATPALLAKLGEPLTPERLSRAAFIGFDRTDLLMDGLNALGLSLTAASFPLISESHLVQWAMARQGLGVCIMPEAIGDADPAVVRALPELPPFTAPTWLTSHRELRTSRRIRLVFDRLAEALTGDGGG